MAVAIEASPVGPDLVARTIGNALSHVAEQRNPAEQTLKHWEADAAPGFLSSLLRIVQQSQAIDEVRHIHHDGLHDSCCA